MTENDAYELLGLQSGASPDALKEAHRRMSKKVHPDQGGSAFLFRQVQEAYELLTKKRSSTAQDTKGAAEAQKAAAEKQRKEAERKQREENERRREAERRQREEDERRKRAASAELADPELVELMSLELAEMRDGTENARSILPATQIQEFLNEIDPVDGMLKKVFAGGGAISVDQADIIGGKIQVLWKEYEQKILAAAKEANKKPKKKKFGFF